MRLVLDRCEIRPWRDDDAQALARHANDREVWRNLRDAFPHPYAIDDAVRFLAMVARQDPVTFFAIQVDGEAAGGIGLSLHSDVERLSAELGYWLARPFWGRGVMSAAVRAFTQDRMTVHGLVRVYALPYARNLASARVLERAGFTCEGRLRRAVIKDGEIQDQLLYACVREEP